MTDPDLRAADARARAEGRPTHPQQDDDGTWHDTPCDCDRPGARSVVHVPDGAIPNGHGGWLMPGPPPDADAAPVDLSGWRDVGYVDETPNAPTLGLVQRGDRLRVVADGQDRLMVVTDDPQTRPDGTVTFGVADAEAHAWMQRLEQVAADLELLRNGGPIVDRAMREAGFPLEPHHAAGKTRTAEEQAVLDDGAVDGAVTASGVDR